MGLETLLVSLIPGLFRIAAPTTVLAAILPWEAAGDWAGKSIVISQAVQLEGLVGEPEEFPIIPLAAVVGVRLDLTVMVVVVALLGVATVALGTAV